MERWGLPDLIPDAVLMTSELATNAVMHAGHPFTVQVDNLGNGVRVTVIDASSDPPTPRQTSIVETGGRGLHMLKAMATPFGRHSSWGQREGGVVRVAKRNRSQGGGAICVST